MLLAHLVPGYFAAALTRTRWDPQWSLKRRALLWGVALGSTVLPDADVVYNAMFRGFINHSLLWTHSIFLYTAIGVLWFVLYRAHRWIVFTSVFLVRLSDLQAFALTKIVP